MPLIIGVTSGGVLVPIQVDANGVMIVDQVSALPAGDNNIGNVDVVTLPALPSGTNLIGFVAAYNYSLVGGAFQKDPIRLGYSGDKSEQVYEGSADAGTNTLYGSVVPAGEIWVVETISAQDFNSAVTKITLFANVNGLTIPLKDQRTLLAAQPIFWSGAITLSEGDKIFVIFNDVTLNDDIYLRYHARRIDIDQ